MAIKGTTDGHSILADGYGFYSDGSYVTRGLPATKVATFAPGLYLHLNMGWSGECDVWYTVPYVGEVGDFSFSSLKGVIYNVFPEKKKKLLSGQVLKNQRRRVWNSRRDRYDYEEYSWEVVPNATVSVQNDSGQIVKTLTTDAHGVYTFSSEGPLSSETFTLSAVYINLDGRQGEVVKTITLSTSTETSVGNRWGENLEFPFGDVHTVTLAAFPDEGGTVTIEPATSSISISDGQSDIYYGTQRTVTAVPKTGYEFVGWQEDGSIVCNAKSYTFYVLCDHMLTAIFEPITYSRALDNDNLTFSSLGSKTWFGQSDYTLDGVDAMQSGKISNGQYSKLYTSTGGGGGVSAPGPGQLSFWWRVSSEENGDILSFSIDGVSQSSLSGSTSWEQKSYSLPEGAHELEWCYRKDGSVSTGADCGWVDQVVWTPAPSYAVKVAASPSGGGTVSGGGPIWSGKSCTVTACPNAGFVFMNWMEDGAVVSLKPDYTFTVTGDKNLTANFFRVPALRAVTVTPRETSVWEIGYGAFTFMRTVADDYPLTVNFNTGGTAIYDYIWTWDDNVILTDSSVTIPAGCASATVIVGFEDDSVENGSAIFTLSLTSGTTYSIGSPSAATVIVKDNDLPNVKYDMEIHAFDSQSEITGIEFASTTGHGGVSVYSKQVEEGECVNLQAPEYVGAGTARKRFREWQVCCADWSALGANIDFTYDPWLDRGDLTLKVFYDDAPGLLVSLDAGGGSVDPGALTVEYGSDYGELPIPTRSGYTFNGWYTGASGSGTQVNSSTTVSTASNHTLYAKWTGSPYTVSLDAQGGLVSPVLTTVIYGSAYGPLPVPMRQGLCFGGWWKDPGGKEKRVRASTVVATASDHTLYAKWVDSYIAPEDDTVLTSVGSFDGYFYAESAFGSGVASALQGTLSLTVSALSGKLTAKAKLQTGSVSFIGKTWSGTNDDGTVNAVLSAKTGEMLSLSVRQNRIWGTLVGGKAGDGLTLDGSRNRFANTKDAEAQTLLGQYASYYTVSLLVSKAVSLGALGAAPEGVGYLGVTVGKGGSAKVAGVLADGTSISMSSHLIWYSDVGNQVCIPLFVPVYSKKGWVGGLFWIDSDTRAVVTDDDRSWYVRWEKPGSGPDGFREGLAACGGYYNTLPSLAAQYLFGAQLESVPYVYGDVLAEWVEDALPDGIAVTVAGTRMTMAKGTTPTVSGGIYTYSGENASLATLAFTARTGIFKGKFNVYYDYEVNGKRLHKAVSVPYAGVLTPVRGEAYADEPAGLGYSLLTDNDPVAKPYKIRRSFPVTLSAE